MTRFPRIVAVTPLEERWVRLRFTDGLVQDVNLAPVLARGGVFTPMHENRSVFVQVRVNPETGTIEWPGEINLDPDVLYGSHEPSTGPPLERRTVVAASS